MVPALMFRKGSVRILALPVAGAALSLAAIPTALVVPPLNLLPLAAVGVGLACTERARRLGLALAAIGVGGLALLATPFVGGELIASLERHLPLQPGPATPPRAIVILGADVERRLGGPPELGALSLERVAAGAALARRTGLPILVSGGRIPGAGTPVAKVMAATLVAQFGLTPRWVEDRSRDTWENAAFSTAILRKAGIGSAWIVSSAWHLPRAALAFRHFGLAIADSPVRISPAEPPTASDFAPRVQGWTMSFDALHEWIGLADYAWRARA